MRAEIRTAWPGRCRSNSEPDSRKQWILKTTVTGAEEFVLDMMRRILSAVTCSLVVVASVFSQTAAVKQTEDVFANRVESARVMRAEAQLGALKTEFEKRATANSCNAQ